MKKIFLSLLIFFGLLPLSNGFIIRVEIGGIIRGNLDYYNFTPVLYEGTPQEFLLNWENIGSVGCTVKTRIDIYNNSTGEFVYTAWSRSVPIEPGAHHLFKAYWYPNQSGNFTAKYRVLLCNDIYEGPEVTFHVLPKNITQESGIQIKKIFNNQTSIQLQITSDKEIHDLLLVPEYPLGWSVEYGYVPEIKKGQTKIITINYNAGIWKKRTISFNLVTKDGKFFGKKGFSLEKNKGLNSEQIIILILSIFLTISVIFNFYFLKRKKKLKILKIFNFLF